MKNIEKYEHEISQLVNEGDDIECAIATAAGITEKNSCSTHDCKECQKKCLEWMYSEYKEPILTEEEKKYIKSVIEPFRQHVNFIILGEVFEGVQRMNIFTTEHRSYCLPVYNESMFSNMNIHEKYTLEELGL